MSDTIADAVPGEFWAIIEDARQDPERFRGILKTMTRDQIVDFYWTYEELANHLRIDRFWPHVDPDLSEDGLAELANWVVSQGMAYFIQILDHPDLIPKRELDPGLLSEAVEEFEERFDDDIPMNTHEWDAEWKQHGKNSPWTPSGPSA